MNRTVDLPEMKAGELVSYELDQAFFALYNRKLAANAVCLYSHCVPVRVPVLVTSVT